MLRDARMTRQSECWLELETKVKQRFAKVSIVSYSRLALMIIASASKFHIYLALV